jgi:hypothetical protein
MSERDLICAILHRGLMDWVGDIRDIPREARGRIQGQAKKWIRSDSDRPFSFRWCAQTLDLDPAAIRVRLKAGRISFRETGDENLREEADGGFDQGVEMV